MLETSETTLQTGEELFAAGEYEKACNIAKSFLDRGEEKKDASLLAAKSFLYLMPGPKNKEAVTLYCSLCRDACAQAQTFDEFSTIQQGIYYVWNDWHRNWMKHCVDILEKCDSYKSLHDLWGEFIKLPMSYTMMDIALSSTISSAPAVEELCKAAGITPQDAQSNLQKQCDNKLSDKEVKSWVFEVACKKFEKAQALVADCDGTIDYVRQAVREPIGLLYLIDTMLSYCEMANADPDYQLKVLKKRAEVIDFMLRALIYPNGQPMSILSGDQRSETITELQGIYAKISKLNPDFVTPALPKIETADAAPQRNSANSGCYVATAVYGSYDCPQVWTLRRFRDYTLAETWYGCAFIRLYYAISPTLVKWFGNTAWFRNMWKPTLDRMVEKLNKKGVDNTPYKDREW